ncbi:carbon storage regulator CsrA [Paenibacillus sp. LjRoot56]|uniref:carbon storage regulator CsrA n=1 Tax=Paenibacillus sp. LjRoot56 TaxID=3342333 RepID=UPI003ECF769D
MLVLSRRKDEAIMLGDDIEIVVLGMDGDQVRLGIKAPKSLQIYRKEIYAQVLSSNQEASKVSLDPGELSKLFKKK